MRAQDFASELSPWLDTFTAIHVGTRHEKRPADCDERDLLVLNHPDISSGEDGDIAGLIAAYLENFHLPPAWIAALRSLVRPTTLSDETWDWLAGLRFGGEIEVDAAIDSNLSLPREVPVAHVLVRDRWGVTELLMRPLTMLLHTAVGCLGSWRAAVDAVGPESLYLMARDDGPLPVYIDGWIAGALGVPEPTAAGRPVGGVKAGYRSFTVIDTFDELKDNRLQEAAAKGLDALAESLAE